jgi:hypothetical protein
MAGCPAECHEDRTRLRENDETLFRKVDDLERTMIAPWVRALLIGLAGTLFGVAFTLLGHLYLSKHDVTLASATRAELREELRALRSQIEALSRGQARLEEKVEAVRQAQGRDIPGDALQAPAPVIGTVH